jgi:hypothetical protein
VLYKDERGAMFAFDPLNILSRTSNAGAHDGTLKMLD